MGEDWKYWFAWYPVPIGLKWVWLKPVGWRDNYNRQYRLWKDIVKDIIEGNVESNTTSYGDISPLVFRYVQKKVLYKRWDDLWEEGN